AKLGFKPSTQLREGLEAFVKWYKDNPAIQPGDAIATYACIDKASAKLGFKPSTQLREGLEAFVKWYKDNPAIQPGDAIATYACIDK
ncbi:hypothetical protein NIA70_20310, partial [[Clostridium] scindens]|nr:hypothetical protein [[Clostridium] scindens]